MELGVLGSQTQASESTDLPMCQLISLFLQAAKLQCIAS